MAFGYDADVVRPLFGMASSNVLSSHGMALARDLSAMRLTSNSVRMSVPVTALNGSKSLDARDELYAWQLACVLD